MISEPEPVLELNPEDAERYGLRDGELVLVESRRGKATLKCNTTDKIKKGTVFLPFHWGRLLAGSGRANLLTIEAIDPYSQQPEFKACAVRVSKKQFNDKIKILILGDDPLSNELADKLTDINPNVGITILNPSDNVSNSSVRIDLRTPVKINTDKKLVEFQDKTSEEYDKLVFSVGKKTYLPPVKGLHYEGIKVIDSFKDAKKLVAREHVLGKAVVIGSKPFSLETAELLKVRGAQEVHLISHDNVLLDKYLDSIGSQLLFHKMKQKGINIILGAEIEEITHTDETKQVILARGRVVDADLIFIESIKRPNLDLPLKTGLLVNKGIVVGEHLETNLPDIYAVGRTAEIKGVMASDAELLSLQADVLSKHLCGDPTVKYTESLDANRFNILGLQIITFGQFNADDERSNVLTYLDKAHSIYKKIVIRDNKIVGGLYIGDMTGAEEVLRLARNASEVSRYRDALLSGNFREKLPTGKVICSCMSVTQDEIVKAIRNGAGSVDALKHELKVAVTCSSCLEEVKELFAKTNSAH